MEVSAAVFYSGTSRCHVYKLSNLRFAHYAEQRVIQTCYTCKTCLINTIPTFSTLVLSFSIMKLLILLGFSFLH